MNLAPRWGAIQIPLKQGEKKMNKARKLVIPILIVLTISALLAPMVAAKPDPNLCPCGDCDGRYEPWCGCGITCRPWHRSNGNAGGSKGKWNYLPEQANEDPRQ